MRDTISKLLLGTSYAGMLPLYLLLLAGLPLRGVLVLYLNPAQDLSEATAGSRECFLARNEVGAAT